MSKIRKNGKLFTEIKRIREHQILSSFDTIFLILVPVTLFISGYIAIHPEILTLYVPSIIYFLFFLTFLFPLFPGVYGILKGSIKHRLGGWQIFFIFLISSSLLYIVFFPYWDIKFEFMSERMRLIFGGYFYLGGMLMGIGVGTFLYVLFLNSIFFPRMREIDTKIKAKYLPLGWREIKRMTIGAIIFGVALIILGQLLIYYVL